jgi:hypothetical protein
MRKIVESIPIFHFSMREIMIRRSRELNKMKKAKSKINEKEMI